MAKILKDPEDGFWEKNSSEGIVGNSEVYQKFEASVVQLQQWLNTLPMVSFTFGISFI